MDVEKIFEIAEHEKKKDRGFIIHNGQTGGINRISMNNSYLLVLPYLLIIFTSIVSVHGLSSFC